MYFPAEYPMEVVVLLLLLLSWFCITISTIQVEVLMENQKGKSKIRSLVRRCRLATVNIQHGALTTFDLEPNIIIMNTALFLNNASICYQTINYNKNSIKQSTILAYRCINDKCSY